jgi:6-phosphogluconolactonase
MTAVWLLLSKLLITKAVVSILEDKKKPHAHMVYFSPDNKYVLSNDLGTDKLNLYKYNPNSNDENLSSIWYWLKAGSGPRHLTFSKNGKFVCMFCKN